MSFGSFAPGLGIAKGMLLGIRRLLQPKATIRYPEVPADESPKFRGRLQLLYDEYGTLKCETCFQCAQACPIECIDMGGIDTKSRFHVHWGPPETYGERREESALRRSGRPVPDRAYAHFEESDPRPVDEILARFDHDPKEMLGILEATQEAYGYLPVAALKRISQTTGAWYAMIYGTASYYSHLRFERPGDAVQAAAVNANRPPERDYVAALGAALGPGPGGPGKTVGGPATTKGRARATGGERKRRPN